MRMRKLHYVAFALKDGTICGALETRKPRKQKYSPKPKIDAEGIYRWLRYDFMRPCDMPDAQREHWGSTIATCLNMKRLLRMRVETRLEQIEKVLKSVDERLARLQQDIESLKKFEEQR